MENSIPFFDTYTVEYSTYLYYREYFLTAIYRGKKTLMQQIKKGSNVCGATLLRNGEKNSVNRRIIIRLLRCTHQLKLGALDREQFELRVCQFLLSAISYMTND